MGCFAADAGAVPPNGGSKSKPAGKATPKGAKGKGDKGSKAADDAAKQQALESIEPNAAEELGGSGQVDPITGLGLRNPVCDKPGQIRSTQTRLSCLENGTPEGTYPSSNYGFDVFIDAGIDAPSGTFAKALVMILNGIWLGLIFVLKLVFALLGLAFGLNPFSDGESMQQIAGGLSRIYRTITDPWLSVVIVAGGIWFAYKGLLRRDLAASVGGTLAGIAMLIVGLWVIHQPAASVGRISRIADEASLTALSAPRSGSLARPTGTFAETMSQTWAQLVEVPFAGLNFSDVRWAMGPPPAEAVRRANDHFCEDAGALALLANRSDLGDEDATKACEQFAQKRYGKPRRVIDLYLRSSPGSPAREDLWDYFDKDAADAYKSKVAAQGGDGVLTRLSMLALFALGLLGAVMLLAWLAIRLFTQAAIAFVLLMAAPFAIFFPMLGESGRRAFKTWGMTLIGASVAKVVYAAFLSVVLLGMTILGQVGNATGFLLACAFAWAVFLKRADLVGWMSVGDVEGGRAISPIAQFLAWTGARRIVHTATGTVGGVARTGSQNFRQRFPNRGPGPGEAAESMLGRHTRGVTDHFADARGVTPMPVRAQGRSPSSGSTPQSRKASGTGPPAKGTLRAMRAGSTAHTAASSFEQTERYLTYGEESGHLKTGGHGNDKREDKPTDTPRASSRNAAPHRQADPRRPEVAKSRGNEKQEAGRTGGEQRNQGHPSQTPGRVVGRPKPAKEQVDRPKPTKGQTKEPRRADKAPSSTSKPPRIPRGTTAPRANRGSMGGRS